MTTHSLFKRLCMPAIAMLLATTLLCPDGLSAAQDSGDSPLIVINVPGDRGDMLAVRVQALLDRYLPGQTVRQRHASITSAESARRTGRLDGASLVVWATQDAPDLLHTATVIQPAVAPLPLEADLPLTLDDTRLRRMLPLLVVGQAAALLNQAEATRAALSTAEALAPRDWPGRAEILYYRGQSQASQLAALEDYQAAFDLQPRWPYAHALAWAHDNLNEPRLALEAIQQAIALAPDLPALRLDSAYFLEQTGDLTAAIAAYDAAQALSPADSTIYWRRAKAYLAAGDPASAQADFDRLVALMPDDPAAYLARTDAGFARQDYQAVLDDVAAALTLQPADPAPYLFAQGLAQLYLGDHSAAIESLEDYTARRPGDPSGWINLGQAYEGAGNTVGAFHAFETALGIDPEATYLHASLARLYYTTALTLSEPSRTHYLNEAIDAATLAVAANRQDTGSYLYRALAALALNRPEAALEDLNAALTIDPAFASATYNRAIVYTRLSDSALDASERESLLRAASADYDTLLRASFAEYSYLLIYQGYLLVELGEYRDAIDHFAAYRELYPDTPYDQTWALYEGRAYLGLSRFEEALNAYTLAREGSTPIYRCEANLQSGLLLGTRFENPAQATNRLQTYLDENCTGNPLLRVTVSTLAEAWAGVSP